jgi:uncharacterized protein (DUF1501 family)
MTTTTTEACCSEFARISRRGLFAGAAALAGTTTVFGSTVLTASASTPTSARAVMVVLSLRGAADGLSLVVPHADPVYYSARPRIAVPATSLLAKDDTFGLHPELAPLLPFWTAGKMAAVHATGLPVPNRSHFSAMEELEDADPGSSVRTGWLNRLIGLDSITSPLQAFNVSGGVAPTSLYGPESSMSGDDVDNVRIPGVDEWDENNRRLRSLHTLWDPESGPMATALRSAVAAAEDFQPVRDTPGQPQNGAVYPGNSDLAQALQTAARIIKGDVGVEVLTVDQGDWDMHTDVGGLNGGRMVNNARELSTSLAAFLTDLGPAADKVTVVCLSEFGRRVAENANRGLDHGYGNVMFLLGAGVKGGTYYGTWPGLSGDLDSDLLVTTDYRSVLSEVVTERFGVSTASVFPSFSPETVGVMSSL